jgi:hypothetical protein
MAELSQMIRWNAGFVRGLAEGILRRAEKIRSSLKPYGKEAAEQGPQEPVAAAGKAGKKKPAGKGGKRAAKVKH